MSDGKQPDQVSLDLAQIIGQHQQVHSTSSPQPIHWPQPTRCANNPSSDETLMKLLASDRFLLLRDGGRIPPHRGTRADMWEELAAEMGGATTGEYVRKRWRGLRDDYRKWKHSLARQKPQQPTAERMHIYSLMGFLEPHDQCSDDDSVDNLFAMHKKRRMEDAGELMEDRLSRIEDAVQRLRETKEKTRVVEIDAEARDFANTVAHQIARLGQGGFDRLLAMSEIQALLFKIQTGKHPAQANSQRATTSQDEYEDSTAAWNGITVKRENADS